MTGVPCNVCRGELKLKFPRVTDTQCGETFAIYQCVSCGLGHTIPKPEDLDLYYGPVYYGDRHGFTAAYCANRRRRIVKSLLNLDNQNGAQPSLLDIGSGDGAFLSAVQNEGWRAVGTEISTQVTRCDGLDVRESLDHVADRAPFDYITLWHSLEHLADPRATLTVLAKLLKRNGRLVIAVPDAGGLQAAVFGSKWFHLDVPRHLYHFNYSSLRCLLKTTGFAVEGEWHQEFEYDLLGWSQSALNYLLAVPNVFFSSLTGKPRKTGKLNVFISFGLGVALSALALPAVAIGTLTKRGGTLVVVARQVSRK